MGKCFLNAAVYCIRKAVIMACTLYVIWKSRLILLNNNNTLRSGYGGYVILAVISGIVHYRLHLNRGVCGTVRDFLLCCHRHSDRHMKTLKYNLHFLICIFFFGTDTNKFSNSVHTQYPRNHLFSVYNVYTSPVMTGREGHTVKSAVANDDDDDAWSPPLIKNNAYRVLEDRATSLLQVFTSVRCTQW